MSSVVNRWERDFQLLKSNIVFPFNEYQKDQAQYMLSELYWNNLFKSVIGGNEDAAWRAWHPPDPDYEGNPIFSAVNLGSKRGTRVIQHPNLRRAGDYNERAGLLSFQPYLGYGPADLVDYENPEGEVLELCLACDISNESEEQCRRFWRLFCVDLLPEADIETLIRKYELSVRAS